MRHEKKEVHLTGGTMKGRKAVKEDGKSKTVMITRLESVKRKRATKERKHRAGNSAEKSTAR